MNIKGYEGLYDVTQEGVIISTKTGKPMRFFFSKGRKGEDKYFRVGLTKNKKQRKFFVHRIIAECFVDNPDGKKFVNHKDGDKTNNNCNNLEWVSQSENQIHAYSEGLQSPNNGVIFKNNTSGYVGVTKSGGKWKAQIRIKGALEYLGLHSTPELASAAYQKRLEQLLRVA